MQDQLARLGLLDLPADGVLGPVTQWALLELCRAHGLQYGSVLTPDLADALLAPEPPLPLEPGSDLAGRIVAAMLHRGDWVCRHPDCFTIAYVEGTAPDGSPTAPHPDAFNDARFLLRVSGAGRPEIVGAWEATTAPGRPAVEHPAEPAGAPRLLPGQHKAWVMGRTGVGTDLEQDALVQVTPLPVTRDEDRDFRRNHDKGQRGLFIMDQHGGLDAPRGGIGGIGAGCLVGRAQDGHRSFIAALRTDPRWRVNHAYRFMTSVLERGAHLTG